MVYFRATNDTDTVVTDFTQDWPVNMRDYLGPGDSGRLQVGKRSLPVSYAIPPAVVQTPSAFPAGQVRVINRPSAGGNQATLSVFSSPDPGAAPITTLHYRYNVGAGTVTASVAWTGPVDYVLTFPGTGPLTLSSLEVWTSNSFGASPITTLPEPPITLTVAVVFADAPLAALADWNLREEMRVEHMVGNPACQNENTFTGFSSGEKAAMTGYTANNADEAFAYVQAMGTSSKIKIACAWNGISRPTEGLNGVDRGLVSGGGTPLRHSVLPSGSLTSSGGTTDSGRIRPDHSVYFYAAPGYAPEFADIMFRGYSRVEIDGFVLGNWYAERATAYPLPAMVAIKNCTVGRSWTSRIQTTGARVVHVENCDFPFGCVADRAANYNRYWNCRITNSGGTQDVWNYLGNTSDIYDDWNIHLWIAGCTFYQVSQVSNATSGSHFDFIQFGAGSDLNDRYHLILEFNVALFDTPRTNNNMQGFFDGDNIAGLKASIHNNVLGFTGAKGFDLKDWFDQNPLSVTRNLLFTSGQGFANSNGSQQTLGNPIKIYLHSGDDANYPIPSPPLIDGGVKRITENFAAGFSMEGGNPLNVLARNQRCVFSTNVDASMQAPNVITGNGTWNVVNNGWRYSTIDQNLTDWQDCRDAILAFAKPIAGWRSTHIGPIDPADWPTDYSLALDTPGAPTVRLEPDITAPTVADGVAIATDAQWVNSEIITRSWQVCDDVSGSPSGEWSTWVTTSDLFLSDALIGKHYRRREVCTNMTGSTEWVSDPVGPITADTLGGTIYTEDWKRSGTPASAGDLWPQLGTGGSMGAPLYARSNSNMTATVVTDATAPSGVAVRIGTASNIFGRLYRTDIQTDMTSGWTTLDLTIRHRIRAVNNPQAAFGFPNVTSTTASSTLVTGIGFHRPSAGAAQARRLDYRAIVNSGALHGPIYADGDVAIYRMRIVDNGDGSFTCRGKSWLAGAAEPNWQTNVTRTAFTPSDMNYIGFNVLNRADAIEVQSYSVRVI